MKPENQILIDKINSLRLSFSNAEDLAKDRYASGYNAGIDAALATVRCYLCEPLYRCYTCDQWFTYLDRSDAEYGICEYAEYSVPSHRDYFCADWSPIEDEGDDDVEAE